MEAGQTILRKYDVLGRQEDVGAALSYLQRIAPDFERDRLDPDFYVLVGGDGVITYEKDKERVLSGKPILRVRHRCKGSNPHGKKSLGFTADITIDGLQKALDDVRENRFFTEKAELIDCFVDSVKKGTAIYDVAVINGVWGQGIPRA